MPILHPRMESSVMTSSSSHRLRSAVSACAQPTHSYINPSCVSSTCLGSGGSHNSGGCFKKFITTHDERSIFERLSKKLNSSNDSSSPCKKSKNVNIKNGLNHLFSSKIQNEQRVKNVNIRCLGNKTDELNNASLDSWISNNECLMKLKSNTELARKRLTNHCVNEASRKKTINITSENNNNNNNISISNVNNNNHHHHLNNYNNNNNISNNNHHSHNHNHNHHHHHHNNNINKSKNHNHNNNNININNNRNNNNINNVIHNGNIFDELFPVSFSKVSENSINGDCECSNCQPMRLDEDSPNRTRWLRYNQPMTTRRSAKFARDIYMAWKSRVGNQTSLVSAELVKPLFNDLKIYPSDAEVFDMIDFEKERNGRPQDANYLTIQEFVTHATEMGRLNKFVTYDPWKKIALQLQSRLSRPMDRDGLDPNGKKNAEISKNDTKWEVFLGGSCNPTTWRADIAMPRLEKMGISFYNPQVKTWTPELIEEEYYAKENAEVLFFVLDNQTRAVAATVEVGQILGSRRNLVLVVQSVRKPQETIQGEAISAKEINELKRGQLYVAGLAELEGETVYSQIEPALENTFMRLRKNFTKNPKPELQLNEKDVFEIVDTNNKEFIHLADALTAFELLTGVKKTIVEFRDLVFDKSGRVVTMSELENTVFNFEQFDGFKDRMKNLIRGREPVRSQTNGPRNYVRDVFLGGTHLGTTWRDSVIPELEKNNLTYFSPIQDRWISNLRLETVAVDRSFVALFVIANTARSVAEMAMAAYYIAKGCNVVLCVQNLPENHTITLEKITPTARKDYNRGRSYLVDIARREGVPVYTSLREAVQCVLRQCRLR